MSTHNICFYQEIMKIVPYLSPNTHLFCSTAYCTSFFCFCCICWLTEQYDHESIEPRHDKTNKMSVRQGKIQISLGMRPVWSESSLCARLVAKDQNFLHADSEDSDQTEQLPSLMIWVFAGCKAILLVFSCGSSIGKEVAYHLLQDRTHWNR